MSIAACEPSFLLRGGDDEGCGESDPAAAPPSPPLPDITTTSTEAEEEEAGEEAEGGGGWVVAPVDRGNPSKDSTTLSWALNE